MKKGMLILAGMFLFLGCEEPLDDEPIVSDPVSMTIESVELQRMPFKDSNNFDWDELSGPDVYLRFEEASASGSVISSATTGVNQDVSPTDLPISWTLIPTFTLGSFSNVLRIFVYDSDLVSDDYIGGLETMFGASNAPDTWTLDLDDDLKIKISVSYTY